MNPEHVSILRCPITGQGLQFRDKNCLETYDGQHQYPIKDGVIDFLSNESNSEIRREKKVVRNFYESWGWERTDDGRYNDTALFVDIPKIGVSHTSRCNLQVAKHVSQGGKYLLDAGSGAIPWPEYMHFHSNYQTRICVDVSIQALEEAKKKLGEKGLYIRADLTRLPLVDDAVDGAVSCHVIYHIPEDEQAHAFNEVARVVKSGQTAAIIYRWPQSSVQWQLSKVFRLLSSENTDKRSSGGKKYLKNRPELYGFSHSYNWFCTNKWEFRYEIRSFRLVDNQFMKKYFDDSVRCRFLVKMLEFMQRAFPSYFGREGLYPLIIIRP